jgi:hypothetical protein
MAKRKQTFHWRGFTSLALLMAFILMAFSGIVLYLSPKGRVANWSGWKLAGLTREEWAGIHTVFALFLILAAGFHIYFNWRPLLYYLKKKAVRGIHLKWELAAVVVLGVVFFLGTLKGVPPFGTILDFGDSMKDYWERQSPRAPQAHAEELTLVQYADHQGVPVESLIQRLKEKGFEVTNAEATIGLIAEQNGVSPSELGLEGRSEPGGGSGNRRGQGRESGGFGRITLKEICDMRGLDPVKVTDRLKSLGIDVQSSDTLRTLAERANRTPHDLLEFIERE